MGITAPRLKTLGLIDDVISEPLGGAHRDPKAMSMTLKKHLKNHLVDLQNLDLERLVEQRYQRWMAFGRTE